MFNVLLKWCWKLSKWLLVGLAPNLIDKGVAITQYAYDTILCITHDPKKAINLKLLLYLSDLMSSLKINYQKIEIFLVGGDNLTVDSYSSLFGCQVGNLPMKYLGVPVTYRSLRISDLDPLDGKFIKNP
jgi:hypothetical protein